MKPPPPVLFFLLLMLIGWCSRVEGQVLVYDLSISVPAEAPDFEFFESGFLVVDVSEGTASFLFLSSGKEGEPPAFVYANDKAQFFFTSVGESFRGNVRSNVKTKSAEASYLLSGEVNQAVKVPVGGVKVSVAVPSELSGFLLASDPNYYRSSKGGGVEEMGIVGIAMIRAILDHSLTSELDPRKVRASEVCDSLVESLKQNGYTILE